MLLSPTGSTTTQLLNVRLYPIHHHSNQFGILYFSCTINAWNSPPSSIQSTTTITTFKYMLLISLSYRLSCYRLHALYYSLGYNIIMYPCISLQKILPSLSKTVEKSMKAELHMDSLVTLYGKINPYGGHLIASKLVCVILSPKKKVLLQLLLGCTVSIYIPSHSLCTKIN